MSYTPPVGSAVTLVFTDSYSPPVGSYVELNFNVALSHVAELNLTGVLEDVSGVIQVLSCGPVTLSGTLGDATAVFSCVPSTMLALSATLGDATGDLHFVNNPPLGLEATLADASGVAHFVNNPPITMSATLGDATMVVETVWSSGVFRGIEASRTGVDESGSIINRQSKGCYVQAAKQQKELSSPQHPAELVYKDGRLHWLQVPNQHVNPSVNWAIADPLSQQRANVYSAPPNRHLSRINVWEGAIRHDTQRQSVYIAPKAKPKAWRFGYDNGVLKTQGWLAIYGLATKTNRRESSLWCQGTPHSWLWGGWHYPPYPPPPIYTPVTLLRFYQPDPNFIGGAILQFGRPCFAWPLTDQNITILDGATIVLHTIQVKRTADNVEIPALSATLKFDSESWAWGVTLNLKSPETMALLETVNGEPREIQIQMDGIYFTAIIEEWGESRQFGENTYSVSGRSSLALFAYPYAPLRSYLEAAEKTAAQLIDYELLNTGWTAVYHASLEQLFTTDWLIPGGAWSYQNKAPIDCVVQIAKAAGARAYADRTAKLVHIDPRYPANPWDWPGETLDQTIPLSLVRSITTHLAPQPDYDHVIVSGQSHGVTVSASLFGSSGAVTAPMVTDNLITYVQAGRERARNILCNTGKQARVTLDLPLNDSTGLLQPGQLVEVEDNTHWRGLVTGTNITASHGQISQSVEIERHYP